MNNLINISLLFCLAVFLVACQADIDENMSVKVDDFEFIDQDADTFSSEALEGDWWIAYFFFTSCEIVCPQTMPNIVSVEESLSDEGKAVPVVGFSVDPDVDTPDKLKAYAEEYQINEQNMTFLTGYDFETIKKVANESFKTVLDSGGPEGHEFAHSTSFFLVNTKGTVVKRYDGLSKQELQDLVDDLLKVM